MFNSIFNVTIVVLLVGFFALLLVVAIRRPDRRLIAVRYMGLLTLFGIAVAINVLPARLPQVSIQIFHGVGCVLAALISLGYCVRDHAAGLSWRQALKKNLGIVIVTAFIFAIFFFGFWTP
jgi:protein-S-isoprenylcysteine O-methyltransferase Ste14